VAPHIHLKSLDFTQNVSWDKKLMWSFFSFTACLRDINAQWDICLVSNKNCLHRIWWATLKTHPLIKRFFIWRWIFTWSNLVHLKAQKRQELLRQQFIPHRWQLALTAASPRCYGMKPTNVAPSYCPMFSFKAPVWESSLKEVSDQSEMLLSVANPRPGLEDHMYGS